MSNEVEESGGRQGRHREDRSNLSEPSVVLRISRHDLSSQASSLRPICSPGRAEVSRRQIYFSTVIVTSIFVTSPETLSVAATNCAFCPSRSRSTLWADRD